MIQYHLQNSSSFFQINIYLAEDKMEAGVEVAEVEQQASLSIYFKEMETNNQNIAWEEQEEQLKQLVAKNIAITSNYYYYEVHFL